MMDSRWQAPQIAVPYSPAALIPPELDLVEGPDSVGLLASALRPPPDPRTKALVLPRPKIRISGANWLELLSQA